MTQEEFFERFQYDPKEDYLGEGRFGQVYKAKDTIKDRWVVIKESRVPTNHKFTLKREVELANEIDYHQNIAPYYNCHRLTFGRTEIDYAVMKYYQYGDLSHIIKTVDLSKQDKHDITLGILEGVKHLHDEKIIHRDLKPGNILMNYEGGKWTPKIADYGLSKLSNKKDFVSNSSVGMTYSYTAPEIFSGEKIKKNIDIWAVGVILYLLFTKELPFSEGYSEKTESERRKISQNVVNGKIPEKVNTINEPYRSSIKQCLIKDNNKRPETVNEFLKNIGINKPKKHLSDTRQNERVDSEGFGEIVSPLIGNANQNNRINKTNKEQKLIINCIKCQTINTVLFNINEKTGINYYCAKCNHKDNIGANEMKNLIETSINNYVLMGTTPYFEAFGYNNESMVIENYKKSTENTIVDSKTKPKENNIVDKKVDLFINFIRKKYNLHISKTESNTVLSQQYYGDSVEISGRCLVTGKPKSIRISRAYLDENYWNKNIIEDSKTKKRTKTNKSNKSKNSSDEKKVEITNHLGGKVNNNVYYFDPPKEIGDIISKESTFKDNKTSSGQCTYIGKRGIAVFIEHGIFKSKITKYTYNFDFDADIFISITDTYKEGYFSSQYSNTSCKIAFFNPKEDFSLDFFDTNEKKAEKTKSFLIAVEHHWSITKYDDMFRQFSINGYYDFRFSHPEQSFIRVFQDKIDYYKKNSLDTSILYSNLELKTSPGKLYFIDSKNFKSSLFGKDKGTFEINRNSLYNYKLFTFLFNGLTGYDI